MKKIILFLSLLFMLSSCTVAHINYITRNPKKTMKVFVKDNDTIILLPMAHVAKPKFYQGTKQIVDSLRKNEYTFFYEGISDGDIDKNSAKYDTLQRKIRKLLNMNINTEYTDKSNKSTPKFAKNKKFVSQTNSKIGVDKKTDINADVTLEELINAHERKHGEIILEPCDFSTDLLDKYECENLKDKSWYAIHTYRDSIATKIVLDAKKSKNVILYGRAHWHMLWANFRDEGYQLIENK